MAKVKITVRFKDISDDKFTRYSGVALNHPLQFKNHTFGDDYTGLVDEEHIVKETYDLRAGIHSLVAGISSKEEYECEVFADPYKGDEESYPIARKKVNRHNPLKVAFLVIPTLISNRITARVFKLPDVVARRKTEYSFPTGDVVETETFEEPRGEEKGEENKEENIKKRSDGR